MPIQPNAADVPSSPAKSFHVRMRAGEIKIQAFYIWIGRAWVSLFFLAGFGIVFNIAMVHLAASYGTDVSGTITGAGTAHSGRTSNYYLEYTFTVDGKTERSSENVSCEIRDRYLLGPREHTLGRPDAVISRDVVVRHFAFGPFSYSGLPQFVAAADKARKMTILAVFWFTISGIPLYLIWFRAKT